MPLRDHFRPPISKHWSWEGFHGGWPMAMVQQFAPLLPPGFIAEPRVHLGQSYEIDVNTYEDYAETASFSGGTFSPNNGGGATATLSPPEPRLTLETEFLEEYAYEVLVFDLNRERELVAGNRDRQPGKQRSTRKPTNVRVEMSELVAKGRLRFHRRSRHDPQLQPVRRTLGRERLAR